MSQQPAAKWYLGILTVLTALFIFGPFAFPLLWKSPRFNLFWKWVITITITGLTVYLTVVTWELVSMILREFKRQGLI